MTPMRFVRGENMDTDLEMYKNAITKYLKSKHNLSDDGIQMLMHEYDIDGLAKVFPNYFYYESPEYWAEFLVDEL